jgi:hypothetical protein
MLPRLRTIVSCFCLVLCVLFAALWVRSCFRFDFVTQRVRGPVDSPNAIKFGFGQGIAAYERDRNPSKNAGKVLWRRGSVTLPVASKTLFLNFEWVAWTHPNGATYERVRIPIWCFILFTLLLAIAIRPQPRWRFGLRDLFTLTTVAALVIGPLAFWLRGIG